MSIFDKLKRGVSDAGTLAKNQIEVNKLKLQVSKNKSQIESIKNSLGRKVFEHRHNSEFSIALFEEEFQMIDALQQKITELEISIHEIYDEKFCACGELNPIDAKFCKACGQTLNAKSEEQHVMQSSDSTVLLTDSSLVENEVQGSESNLKEEAQKENLETTKICSQCGANLSSDVQFCGDCGTPVQVL